MAIPVASGTTVTRAAGASIQLSSLFTYSDLDNDIVSFAVRDRELVLCHKHLNLRMPRI